MPVEVFRAKTPVDARRLQETHRKEMLAEIQRKASIDSAMATQRVVAADAPVDTGLYKNSWEVRRGDGRKQPTVLANDAPHSGIIEAGARPHWPPLAPLIEWARRKAGDLALGGKFSLSRSALSKSGRYRGQASLTAQDELAVIEFAKGVQRKIAARGQKPLWIMKKRLPYARKALAEAFEFYLALGIRGNRVQSD